MQSTVTRCSCQAPVVTIGANDIDDRQLETAQYVYLLVRGMGCPTCALRVRTALLAVEGVLNADVLLDKGVALVYYDPEQVNLDDLPTAVRWADPSGRHHYAAKVLSIRA